MSAAMTSAERRADLLAAAEGAAPDKTPEAWFSDFADLLCYAAVAAAKSGKDATEIMGGVDFVMSSWWQELRGESFPYLLDKTKLNGGPDA